FQPRICAKWWWTSRASFWDYRETTNQIIVFTMEPSCRSDGTHLWVGDNRRDLRQQLVAGPTWDAQNSLSRIGIVKQVTPASNLVIDVSVGSRLPVYLLTGFLGSGKTKTLRKFLAEPVAAGTAVIVNEFAEIGIDQTLIQHREEDIISLTNGCVC